MSIENNILGRKLNSTLPPMGLEAAVRRHHLPLDRNVGRNMMELAFSKHSGANLAPSQENDPSTRRQTRVDELQSQVMKLAESMRIAVIFGGDKRQPGAVINPTYNPRHWKSYEAVAEDIAAALRRIGFRFVTTLPDDMNLGDRLRRERVHFAWLNSGGVQGIGSVGHAAAMMEMFGIPYVGHNPLSAATMDSKNVMKRDLMLAGLPTAPFFVWHPGRGPLDPTIDPRFRKAFESHEGTFVVKPISGRASRDVSAVDSIECLHEAVEAVHKSTGNAVLIETYLPGREFCVAVCGEVVARRGQLGRMGQPFTFAAVERALDQDERIFTSMDHRPITTDRVRQLTSDSDSEVLSQLKQIARQVYSEFDIETLIRLDVRADTQGRLFILEANPKPDLAAPTDGRVSIVCAGLQNEGMRYDDLILSLIADRVDVLFTQRRAVVRHLASLLN
ncbi:MAG: D-alanyl-alanine synthetase [Pseudomonadota bacterium]